MHAKGVINSNAQQERKISASERLNEARKQRLEQEALAVAAQIRTTSRLASTHELSPIAAIKRQPRAHSKANFLVNPRLYKTRFKTQPAWLVIKCWSGWRNCTIGFRQTRSPSKTTQTSTTSEGEQAWLSMTLRWGHFATMRTQHSHHVHRDLTLLPATIFGFFQFGFKQRGATTCVSAVAAEWLCLMAMKRTQLLVWMVSALPLECYWRWVTPTFSGHARIFASVLRCFGKHIWWV